MRRTLKIFMLVFAATSLSFSKVDVSIVDGKKIIELQKKYNLRMLAGKAPANIKRFATLEQFEAYLKSRKDRVAKVATISSVLRKRISESTSVSVTSSVNEHHAVLDFSNFRNEYYPDRLSLTWFDNSSEVNTHLSHNMFDVPYAAGYYYQQKTGSRSGNTINVTGEYEETYGVGTGLWVLTLEYEVSASIESGTISANAYLEDRGW